MTTLVLPEANTLFYLFYNKFLDNWIIFPYDKHMEKTGCPVELMIMPHRLINRETRHAARAAYEQPLRGSAARPAYKPLRGGAAHPAYKPLRGKTAGTPAVSTNNKYN